MDTPAPSLDDIPAEPVIPILDLDEDEETKMPIPAVSMKQKSSKKASPI